jgi:hypothetical protein
MYTCLKEMKSPFPAKILAASSGEYENIFQETFKAKLISTDKTIAANVLHSSI